MTDSADGLEPRLQTPSQLPHTLLNISYHFESLHQLKALWRKKSHLSLLRILYSCPQSHGTNEMDRARKDRIYEAIL